MYIPSYVNKDVVVSASSSWSETVNATIIHCLTRFEHFCGWSENEYAVRCLSPTTVLCVCLSCKHVQNRYDWHGKNIMRVWSKIKGCFTSYDSCVISNERTFILLCTGISQKAHAFFQNKMPIYENIDNIQTKFTWIRLYLIHAGRYAYFRPECGGVRVISKCSCVGLWKRMCAWTHACQQWFILPSMHGHGAGMNIPTRPLSTG